MATYTFDLAKASDESQLRQLLRETPMKGEISVVFAREPDYFHATRIEGEDYRILTARQGSELVGMGSVSTFDAYINQSKKKIGYLSQLRVRREYQGDIRLLSGGYKKMRDLIAELDVPCAMTTIVEDNFRVRDLLTSHRLGLPYYSRVGKMITYSVFLKQPFYKRHTHRFQYQIERASRQDADEIVAFLNTHGKEKLFYPVYTKARLESDLLSRGLSWDSFYMARKQGQLVGVTAIWDQSAFKQTMIHSYHGKIKRIKPVYNMLSTVTGLPALPEEGKAFSYLYVSHTAVKDNDDTVFDDLFAFIYGAFTDKPYDFIMVGFSEQDPLIRIPEKYRHIKYPSILYLVHWDEPDEPIRDARLSRQIPYLEIARL
ncbi:MAG: hypothetical protein H0Z33_03220 [Bacillaceae bacterium]|nr:hypothetical protein [Bacillaceae bacterium]